MVTVEELRERLEYRPQTGELIWRIGKYKGHVAGTPTRAKKCRTMYVILRINGRRYLAHRIIWAMITGSTPLYEIDHEDGDGLNNRLDNLRDVPHKVNTQNSRKQRNNTSGHTGVSIAWNGMWRAEITNDRKKIYIGVYVTKEEAIAARKEAEKFYGYHELHGTIKVGDYHQK